MTEIHFDALLPGEMARRAENVGVYKAETSAMRTFALSLLAGGFIAMGAVFATTTAAGTAGTMSYGVSKLLIGFVFCLGLILVVVGGAELFTGNNLIVMAWANGKVKTRALLRNWTIVYVGNFIGSIVSALLVYFSKQYTFGAGSIGKVALGIANSKVVLDFGQAVALGVLCNVLVCLAVWLTFSARSTIDKIAAVIFPVTAFVAAGFEHSVANMFLIPIGLLIKNFDPAFAATTGLDLANLTWRAFFIDNLLPVTIGNIIGGSIFVAATYWAIFLRQSDIQH
jgi:formate transporter